jgi:hypothetical protein
MTTARNRQRYLEDPAYRARRLAENRAWREANKERVNEEKRRLYATDPEYRARTLKADRSSRLQRVYGITLEEYDVMLKRQRGVCAICERKFKQSLCVDHCHTTRLLRALLCAHCNVALGNFRDNPRWLRKAARYIEYWARQHAKQQAANRGNKRAPVKSTSRKKKGRPRGGKRSRRGAA